MIAKHRPGPPSTLDNIRGPGVREGIARADHALSSRGRNMLRTIKTATLLGLSIVAASSDAHAQQSGKPPRIGVIVSLTSPSMVRTIHRMISTRRSR
jgi:hypothetical protein